MDFYNLIVFDARFLQVLLVDVEKQDGLATTAYAGDNFYTTIVPPCNQLL